MTEEEKQAILDWFKEHGETASRALGACCDDPELAEGQLSSFNAPNVIGSYAAYCDLKDLLDGDR